MKQVFQKITGGNLSDCFPACIASILEEELENIPYVPLSVGDDWYVLTKYVLSQVGIYLIPIGQDIEIKTPCIRLIGYNNPDFNMMVSHAVIGTSDSIIHDPARLSQAEINNLLRLEQTSWFFVIIRNKKDMKRE